MAHPVAYLVERELRVWTKLWHGIVFSGFILPALFLAAMGVGLGGLVDERPGDVAGLSYLHFITPGLLVATALQEAAFSSMWPVLGGLKWDRRYLGQVNTPATAGDVFLFVVAWIGLRTAATSAAFLVVAALLGGIGSWWGVLAMPAAVLCATGCAAPLAAWAVGRDTEVPFTAVMRLGFMPLFLFSGTFFPIDTLPDAIEPLAWLSPLWHGVELARHATTGDGAIADLAHVAVLAALLALGIRAGLRTFPRRLTP